MLCCKLDVVVNSLMYCLWNISMFVLFKSV
jgi:hypothetical protein